MNDCANYDDTNCKECDEHGGGENVGCYFAQIVAQAGDIAVQSMPGSMKSLITEQPNIVNKWK